jgi:hypothetical protein
MTEHHPSERRTVGSRLARAAWRVGWVLLLLVAAAVTYGLLVVGGH